MLALKIFLGILIILIALSFLYFYYFIKPRTEGGFCFQTLEEARNPITGEIRTFSTPCYVPKGWQKINSEI